MDLFWLIPGGLAGGSRPGGGRLLPRVSKRRLAVDLTRLRADGVDALLTLTERPLPPLELYQNGLVAMHLPVRDFTAPTAEQLATAVGWLDRQLDGGKTALVHCGGGRGRTGTVLAAWLIAHGRTVEAAVAEVRRARPGAVETRGQMKSLRRFALDVDGGTTKSTPERCDNQA